MNVKKDVDVLEVVNKSEEELQQISGVCHQSVPNIPDHGNDNDDGDADDEGACSSSNSLPVFPPNPIWAGYNFNYN